jgi:hypothetical protein
VFFPLWGEKLFYIFAMSVSDFLSFQKWGDKYAKRRLLSRCFFKIFFLDGEG